MFFEIMLPIFKSRHLLKLKKAVGPLQHLLQHLDISDRKWFIVLSSYQSRKVDS